MPLVPLVSGTLWSNLMELGRPYDAARCKLEQSALPVETIAEQCGFGNTERMRRTFQRLFNISPHDYRARFRSTLLN